MSRALQSPPSELLDEERLCRVLADLEFPASCFTGDWIDDVYVDLDAVAEHNEGVRRWWTVDGNKVKPLVYGRRRSAYSYGCDCERRGLCSHVAAVLLCVAWADPDWRARFTSPLWEVDLLPLAPRGHADAAEPHKGHIRYHLTPGGGSVAPLRLTMEVIRRSRSGSASLKPAKAPRSLVKLRAMVTPVHPWDVELHQAATHLAKLESLADRAWKDPSQFDAIAGHVGRLALRPLAKANDVRHGGESVRVSLDPVAPRIVASRFDGRLVLAWAPSLLDVWSGGLVLTDDRVLRPVAEGIDVDALLTPLPVIPGVEERRFVQEMVVERGLPVDLPGDVSGVVRPGARSVRLVLEEEQEGVLLVRPIARYVASGEPVEVDLADGGAIHADADVGLIRRDLDWERHMLGQIEQSVGGPAALRLSDDDALDFLTDTLPILRQTWDVFGEQSLLGRARGELEATAVVRSGVDLFELDVEFEADDTSVPAPRVLRSWLDGHRYHRLDDGTVVRLPEAWLARHGEVAHDLVEMQAEGGRLGAHAAWVAQDLLAESGEAAAVWQDLVARIAAFEGVAERPLPAGVHAELRDYQQRGWAWLAFLRDHSLGGVLADDMGLGKTLQVLVLLADTHGSPGAPSLVVAPTSVLHNWVAEAERFVPGLRVVLHHGPGRVGRFDDADLVITTYSLLRRDAELLAATHWRTVVLDEAQAIKNPGSAVAKAARGLVADLRLALTGTPLENRLSELWSLFTFAMPGFFGSRRAFARRFAVPIERERSADALAAMRARIRPFLLRRLKSEVAKELPPRQVGVLRCDLSDPERALYDRVRETYRQSVLSNAAGSNDPGQSLHILEALTRLRQACCHPSLLPFDEAKQVTASAKLDLLLERLDSLIAEGHRSLVFSQWPSLLRIARERMHERGWETAYLDGSTQERGALVERFNSPSGPPVFLISVKAGGTGLNLTAADCVFHLDPWWNPAVEDQATDRAHRIGQDKPVLVYRLIASDTVEELVLELQERKRALARAAVDQDRLVVQALTRDDLLAVFESA